MSAVRPGVAGATRTCPHCKATILESSAVCPACRGHLRFDAPASDAAQRFVPLKVEGTLNAPDDGAFEYTMVVVIRSRSMVCRNVLVSHAGRITTAAPLANIPSITMPEACVIGPGAR